MSITDELREYAEKNECKSYCKLLTAIADRIDAEHQKALDEWKVKQGQMWLKGYAECHAELIEDNETLASDLESCGWVRLPKDADGEYIHIGDVMEFSAFEVGKPPTRMVDGVGQGVFFAWCGERGYQQHEAKRYRHYHAPTVEDVLREMHMKLDEVTALYVGEAIDSDERDRDEARIFAEYAKRLMLAEWEDA